MRCRLVTRKSSVLTMATSIGKPTDELLLMVESTGTSAHLMAYDMLMPGWITRSKISLPYLLAP